MTDARLLDRFARAWWVPRLHGTHWLAQNDPEICVLMKYPG
jgi:hypothetical protein